MNKNKKRMRSSIAIATSQKGIGRGLVKFDRKNLPYYSLTKKDTR